MSQFRPAPAQYLSLPGEDSSCSIDIANILPPFLRSVRNASMPMPKSPWQWRARNQVVDHDII